MNAVDDYRPAKTVQTVDVNVFLNDIKKTSFSKRGVALTRRKRLTRNIMDYPHKARGSGRGAPHSSPDLSLHGVTYIYQTNYDSPSMWDGFFIIGHCACVEIILSADEKDRSL